MESTLSYTSIGSTWRIKSDEEHGPERLHLRGARGRPGKWPHAARSTRRYGPHRPAVDLRRAALLRARRQIAGQGRARADRRAQQGARPVPARRWALSDE